MKHIDIIKDILTAQKIIWQHMELLRVNYSDQKHS